jgi:hypothetical protein
VAEKVQAAEKVIDQGRVWWPPGLPGQESVKVLFNQALSARPAGLTVEDYETHAPFDVEVVLEQQGTGKWARWTGATVKFKKVEQRGKPFRWTALK